MNLKKEAVKNIRNTLDTSKTLQTHEMEVYQRYLFRFTGFQQNKFGYVNINRPRSQKKRGILS